MLIGSDFEEDKSELRLVQQINEVKRAMGGGSGGFEGSVAVSDRVGSWSAGRALVAIVHVASCSTGSPCGHGEVTEV